MLLRTNAKAVAQRLRRFQHLLPGALRQTVAPEYWRPRLEFHAEKAIVAQWQSERSVRRREIYLNLTRRIVRSISAMVFEGGVTFEIKMPEDLGPTDMYDWLHRAMIFNMGIRTPTGRVGRYAVREEEAQEHLEAARQAVRDWVALEKSREPERDVKGDGTPYSDEELAERMMEILGLGESVSPRARTAEMEAAAEHLRGAIEKWLDGEGTSPATTPDGRNAKDAAISLDPAVIRQWFEAVMLAWIKVIQRELPFKLKYQVFMAWERAGELI